MKQNEASSAVHRTEARDAGSRPAMLMLKRPAIDVMAEYKAFPRRPKGKPHGQNWFEMVVRRVNKGTNRSILNTVQSNAQANDESRTGS